MTAGARNVDARSQREVSVRAVWPVLAYARDRGLDIAALAEGTGVDAARLRDGDARMPHAALVAIWEAAARACEDAALGLHAAEHVRPGTFDVLDYAVRTSATLGEALRRLGRYHRVLHDTALVHVRIEADVAWVTKAAPPPRPTHAPSSPPLPRHVAEFVVTAWLLLSREITGLDITPHEVCFAHAAPADLREHERILRAPLRFSAPVNGLALPRLLLDVPLVKADPGLAAVLERFLEASMPPDPAAADTLGQRVRHLLADGLSTGPRIDSVARRLRMSRRTLHRQLAEEGTSFADLLDGLRRDLAAQYLTDARLAIGEIAFLLGFSEPSAFHRAFKRWYGESPGEHRRRVSA